MSGKAMTKIDLITGFLGAGKTTFIRLYVKHLLAQGLRVCILENDYGAVNVDMMLLTDLGCDIEMVAGGCDYDCHKRRFRTKLIAMGMLGYDRVIVEPSGIFDVDEFFDALQEEPLDRWYEAGHVIAIVDARLPEALSEDSEYLLASEIADSGLVVFSHAKEGSLDQISAVLDHINRSLTAVSCRRKLSEKDILVRPWDALSEEDWSRIDRSEYRLSDHIKKQVMEKNDYETIYFMNHKIGLSDLESGIRTLFFDPRYGNVLRVKGFLPQENGWLEVNATRDQIDVKPISEGHEILVVIGEELNEPLIRQVFA